MDLFGTFPFYNNQKKRTEYSCASLSSPQKTAKFLQTSLDMRAYIKAPVLCQSLLTPDYIYS